MIRKIWGKVDFNEAQPVVSQSGKNSLDPCGLLDADDDRLYATIQVPI